MKIIVRVLGAALAALLVNGAAAEGQTAPSKTFKILHVMSYHTPWRWTEGQLSSFKEGLGVPAEYKVFEMDTKHFSAREQTEAKAREARALIDSWKPDLVYTTDDDAQEYVAKHYVDSPIPIVFSGVNKHPVTYGFDSSKNVTGVLEHEHFVGSLRLLKAMVPGVRRVAAVFDDASMWAPVKRRMKESLAQIRLR